MFHRPALHRLAKALNLPSNVTDVTIRLPAAGLAEMTIERILTAEEIDALSEWYVTENIEAFQLGETTYTLERRKAEPQQDGGDPSAFLTGPALSEATHANA